MAELTRLFPASTNAAYHGSPISAGILGLAVVATLIPSLIHTLLPDGGANVIAGLGVDLAAPEGKRVVSLMAWAGTTQFVWGLMLGAILLRYRSFVPLALGLLTIERCIHAWNMWGPKGLEEHPPEAWGTLGMIPLFGLGFVLALRRKTQEVSADG